MTAPNSLLIRDIHTLVSMDDAGAVLHGAYIYRRTARSAQVGSGRAGLPKATRVIRAPPRGRDSRA